MWVTENKRNIPQVGSEILFKPRVDKVIFAQTTGGLCVITPILKVTITLSIVYFLKVNHILLTSIVVHYICLIYN